MTRDLIFVCAAGLAVVVVLSGFVGLVEKQGALGVVLFGALCAVIWTVQRVLEP